MTCGGLAGIVPSRSGSDWAAGVATGRPRWGTTGENRGKRRCGRVLSALGRKPVLNAIEGRTHLPKSGVRLRSREKA